MIGIHSNHLSEQWHECLCARRRLSNKRATYIQRILAMEFTLSHVPRPEINLAENFINIKL